MQIRTTDLWRRCFPESHVGTLVMTGINNHVSSRVLDTRKKAIESRIRQKYKGCSRQNLMADPILKAYRDYYRHFKKTYHVQLQLESVAFKDKSIPSITPLVDANFMAELQTFILSAGHDADRLGESLTIDASREDETFIQMNGTPKRLKPDDMVMRDTDAVVCSIIYGQDRPSRITAKTEHALFTAYAPSGIQLQQVETHLAAIREIVKIFSPQAKTSFMQLFSA